MRKFTKINLGIIIVLVISVVLSGQVFAHTNPSEKVSVCHKTGSETNPWVVQEVNANELQSHLDNGDFLYAGLLKDNGHPDQKAGNEWCNSNQTQPSITPTLTPTPTKKPCLTPTVTPVEPSVTPTITPTVTPPVCEGEDCGQEPTPTVSVTPIPETPNNGGGNPESKAPVCTDGNTVRLPANPHVIRAGERATVNFFITEGSSANIYWRVVGSNDWQNAVSDVQPNSENFVSYTIHGLNPNLGYDFGVQQKVGCGGGQLVTAVIVDGPQVQTFHFSFWEWSK